MHVYWKNEILATEKKHNYNKIFRHIDLSLCAPSMISFDNVVSEPRLFFEISQGLGSFL